MDHLVVIALAICIIIGSAAIFHSLSIYKLYKLPALKAFIWYLSIYNFVMLLSFFSQYILKNISSLGNWVTYLIVIIIMGGIGFILYLIEIYLIIYTMWNLLGKEISNIIQYLSFGIFILWLIFYSIGTSFFIAHDEKFYLLNLYSISSKVGSIIFFSLSIFFIIVVQKIQQTNKKRALVTFGIIFIIFAFVDLFTFLLPYSFNHLVTVLNGIFLNLVFLFLLKPFLKLFIGNYYNIKDFNISFEQILKRYNISSRESEIIELIVHGKSNKEIEQLLFISQHTVKNHIYNIFQKTGVNSRSQLINLILNSNNN